MKEIFISYATQDEGWAEEIAQMFARRKIDFFMAREAIRGDEDAVPEIRKVLEDCRTILVLMTPQSLESHWVKIEVELALELDKEVVPVLLRALKKETTPSCLTTRGRERGPR